MATQTQEIPRDAWGTYFDELSRTMGTQEVTIEVAGRDLGAQIAAERLVLSGVSYDHKDDVVVIGVDAPGGTPEEYEHLVEHPRKVQVATGASAEVAIDIEDHHDHHNIMRMQPAPALPGE